MRQIICVIGLTVLCISPLLSQKSLDSSLLILEEKIYREEKDTLINQLILEKVRLLLDEQELDTRILFEIKRVKPSLIIGKAKIDFLWNASIISYLTGETYSSLHYFDLYQNLKVDTTIQNTLLSFLVYSGYNNAKADLYLNQLIQRDSTFNTLNCFNEVQAYELKHKKMYGILSMILPGAGLILNQEYRKGITSLGLNTASVFAISWFYQQNVYLNMFGWGSNLITKFYIGGLSLTDKTVINKESMKKEKLATSCELQLKKVLEKYPLNFKY